MCSARNFLLPRYLEDLVTSFEELDTQSGPPTGMEPSAVPLLMVWQAGRDLRPLGHPVVFQNCENGTGTKCWLGKS